MCTDTHTFIQSILLSVVHSPSLKTHPSPEGSDIHFLFPFWRICRIKRLWKHAGGVCRCGRISPADWSILQKKHWSDSQMWLLTSLEVKVKGQGLKVSDFVLHQGGDLLEPIRQLHLLTRCIFFQRHDDLHANTFSYMRNTEIKQRNKMRIIHTLTWS